MENGDEENKALKTKIVNLSAGNAEQGAKMAEQDEVIHKLLERVEKLKNRDRAKLAPVAEKKPANVEQMRRVHPKVEQTKAEQLKPETKTVAMQKLVSGKNIQVFSLVRKGDATVA